MKETFLKTVMEGAGIGRKKAEYLWDIGLRLPAEQHHGEPVAWIFRQLPEAQLEVTERWDVAKHLPYDTTPVYKRPAQGEPVALPARKQWGGLLPTADNLRGEGWNACLEEIAKLGPLYTRPAQSEPVAYADPKSFENFKAMAHLGGLYLHEWMWAEPKPGLVPLYAHADPGEVERLREQIKEWQETSVHWMHKCDTLRADVETMRRKNNEYWHETETLRAQLATEKARGTLLDDARIQAEELQWSAERKLAERDTLLRDFCAHSALICGDLLRLAMEDDCATTDPIRARAYSAMDHSRKVKKALSASAEPSAPKCEACKGHGVIGWTRGQTAESFEQGESPCEDCNATGCAHSNGMPVSGACTTCNGLGTVPDGEIAGLDGVEFANGPIECIKDCPDCKPVERDERAAFERAFVVQEGVFFSPERKEYRSMNGRTIEETDSIDLNLRLSGWLARAALERKP